MFFKYGKTLLEERLALETNTSHHLNGYTSPLQSSVLWCPLYKLFSSFPSVPDDVRCPSLPAPANGSIDAEPGDQSVGTVVLFSCDGGFDLRGSRRRTCQNNGAWSGRETVCERELYTLQSSVMIL